jgi:hypothetical protein
VCASCRYLLCLLLTTAVGLLSLVAYRLNIGAVQEDIVLFNEKLAEYIQGGMARESSSPSQTQVRGERHGVGSVAPMLGVRGEGAAIRAARIRSLSLLHLLLLCA